MVRAILLLGLGLAMAEKMPARTKTPSSLEEWLIKIKADTGVVNEKLRLGKMLKNEFPDSAKAYNYEALHLSKTNGFTDGAAQAFLGLGLQSLEKGKYEESQFFFEQALPYCRLAIFNKGLIAAYYNDMAMLFFYRGSYPSANSYFHKALAEMKKRNIESASTVLTYNNLALIQYILNQYDRALFYANKGEEIGRKGKFNNQLAYILTTKGSIHAVQKKYTQAKTYYLEALKFAKANNDIQNEAVAITNLGEILLGEHQASEAVHYFNEAIQLANKCNLPALRIGASFNLGGALFDLGKYGEAENMLTNGLKEAEALGSYEGLLAAHQTLASVYSSLGKDKLAYEHLQKAWLLKDSLMGKEKTDVINTLEVKYRTSEKDKEIAKKQLQITTQERNLARKNLWIASISATTLLLSGLVLGLYRSNRHKQRLQKAHIKTLEQEKDLRAMQSMILGEEKERSRMARELHDGIGGMLTSVEMHFGILEKRYEVLKEAKDYNEAMQALQDTTAEVRKTAHNLMPEMLLRHGLPEAIRIFCLRVAKGEKLEIDFQNIGETAKLDGNFELSLYRIVQELVQNIVRHANASQALVQLSWYKDQISLLVEDNGSGLPPWDANGTPGLGLENLNWRVKSMRGQLTIDSKPGEGTSIYIEFLVASI